MPQKPLTDGSSQPRRRNKYEFMHFEAVVLEDPKVYAEQYVSCEGKMNSRIVNVPGRSYHPISSRFDITLQTSDQSVSVPYGSLIIETEYEYECVFWIRNEIDSVDMKIVTQHKSPDVLKGHRLLLFTSCRSGDRRKIVLVGYYNINTRHYTDIIPCKLAMKLIGLNPTTTSYHIETLHKSTHSIRNAKQDIANRARIANLVISLALACASIVFAVVYKVKIAAIICPITIFALCIITHFIIPNAITGPRTSTTKLHEKKRRHWLQFKADYNNYVDCTVDLIEHQRHLS